MTNQIFITVALSIGSLATTSIKVDAADFTSSQENLKLNQIQVIGTHNSYHIQPSPTIDALLRLDPTLALFADSIQYTHLPLQDQFESQNIRQIELDVFLDPNGGLYANPLGPILAAANGLPPEPDFDPNDVNQNPGLKVLHVQDIDYRSTCLSFVGCLQEVKAWSDSNPNHSPIVISVEAKDDPIPPFAGITFTNPIAFDAAGLDSIEREILSVFLPEQLLTPDLVRGNYSTLNESILDRGWPTLLESKGKILFALDTDEVLRDLYLQDHPSLRDRIMFTDSKIGEDEAAFFYRNNPFDLEIAALVKQGYLVRTRADADTLEARFNSTVRRDVAFASGAQFISTDYPVPNLDFSNYAVSFGKDVVLICNSVSGVNCDDSPQRTPESNSSLVLLAAGLLLVGFRKIETKITKKLG